MDPVVVATVVVVSVPVVVVALQSRTATGERKMPVVDQDAPPHGMSQSERTPDQPSDSAIC